MLNIEQGGIYKLPFPFTDQNPVKFRPAVALSLADNVGDVKFAFITTTPVTETEQAVTLKDEDYQGEPLAFPGHVRLEKTFILPAGLVQKKLAQLTEQTLLAILRLVIQSHVPTFAELSSAPKPFVPGQSSVPVSGKVIGTPELQFMVDASLDGWLTTGRFNKAFERRLANFLGAKYALTVNSGSSANLLAFSALTSHTLGERAIRPGDEVITVAAGFPTTVNPILQCGCVPVFVDVHIPSYNIDVNQLEAAITSKTKAIMLAHTLGNPFNLAEVTRIAAKYRLWLVEDCCDALGSRYTLPGDSESRLVGGFGDISTLSFYPAHHITMGEGGAVFTNNRQLKQVVESLRDWGRDCYCPPGKDNTCGKRFCWQLGNLPEGYDHKYIYSHLGYNLKITDMQAACALAQMDRLPGFIETRKENFALLKECLKSCEEFLLLPEATPSSDPSWFGFPITLKATAKAKRIDLLKRLDQAKIGTRLLFAGNITHQPYMLGREWRISGELTNTDIVMNNTFWLGVCPGLTEAMRDHIVATIEAFFDR